jgi:hypothetical protein
MTNRIFHGMPDHPWRIPSSVAHFESLYAQLRAQEDILSQILRPSAYVEQFNAQLEAYERSQAQIARLLEPLESWQRSRSTFMDALNVASSTTHALERAMAAVSSAPAHVTHQIESLLESYNKQMRLIATSGHLLRAFEEAATLRGQWLQFEPLLRAQEVLSKSSVEVYEQLTTSPLLADSISPWLTSAPAIEPYSSSRALAIVSRADVDLEATRDEVAENQLSLAIDDLEARLAAVSPLFVTPYRGARIAVMSRHDDWHRHAAASLRELMAHLLKHLAPDSALDAYYANPAAHKENGQYTRKAQLVYVFRRVAVDSYAKMAEKDIDIALATFFPSNSAVHEINSPFSDEQLLVLWRRMQGSISVVLEAATVSERNA